MKRSVFLTGATGYIGRRLAAELVNRGHDVRALVRPDAQDRVASGAKVVVGNALDAASYRDRVSPADTFVHLVGVAHPGPSKVEQFQTIDLASLRAAVDAARAARVGHFVYVSVAQPAPVMREYVASRRLGEEHLVASCLTATLVRPWYVLGPGHWWPLALLPMYGIAHLVPRWREAANRLGLVTIRTMVRALAACVEEPTAETRVLDVPAIRRMGARGRCALCH